MKTNREEYMKCWNNFWKIVRTSENWTEGKFRGCGFRNGGMEVSWN